MSKFNSSFNNGFSGTGGGRGGGAYSYADGFGLGDQGGGFYADGNLSSTQSGEKKGQFKTQELLPITIATIVKGMKPGDEGIRIGDSLSSRISFVAQVKHVAHTSSNITYTMDDKSGATIEVLMWTTEPEARDIQLNSVTIGQYARVHGNVKTFQEAIQVMAYSVSPVTDLNELTMHIQEVLYSHAYLSKGDAAAADTTQFGTAVGAISADDAYGGGGNAYEGQGSSLFGNNVNLKNFTPVQAAVMAVYDNQPNQPGVHTNAVFAAVKGHSKQAVKEAIEFLNAEGHIYQTNDDNWHVKVGYN